MSTHYQKWSNNCSVIQLYSKKLFPISLFVTGGGRKLNNHFYKDTLHSCLEKIDQQYITGTVFSKHYNAIFTHSVSDLTQTEVYDIK